MAGGLSVGKSLIGAMLEVAPMHEYLVIIPEEVGYPDYAQQDNVEVLWCPLMPHRKRLLWERRTLREAVTKFSPDWIWSLGNIPIPRVAGRQSLLIQNSMFVYTEAEIGISRKIPERFKLWLGSQRISKGLKKISHVHLQTDVMRRRFSKTFRFPYERTIQCQTPLSAHFFEDYEYETPEIFERYADRFKLLYVTFGSGGGGHKNLDGIVSMYARYREELAETVCFLTIDKTLADLSGSICERIEKEELGDLIVPTGTIPFQQIRNYYHSADACFFPSRLETVGLPQWEAMASGLPVIASDLDFAHEVCGDAAIFVDPFAITSMKDGILRMKEDQALRETLIQRGYDQVRKVVPCWADSVRHVLDAEGIEHQ